MRYLSVCSGIEAATVAWHHMGWEPVAYSEIEPFPSAVLKHHYPSVPNWGDMTKFQEWPDANINVLVGGTPCQSFSVAGLRKGLADPRGNLMLTYLAIAQRYRPKWLVWENVPGVLSSEGGRDFAALLRGLDELGYGWAYRVLDAQYFGVAQRRRRVFVVGHLGNWQRAAAVLFERHSLSGHPAPSRQARKGTASNAASGVGAGGWPAEVSPTLNACFGSKQGQENQHINGGAGMFVPVAFDAFNQAETGELSKTVASRNDQDTASLVAGCWWDGGDVAATITTKSDDQRMPDKANAQLVMQPIPYDLYQITAPVNRQNRKPGDPCHTLARDNAAHAAVAIQGTLIGRGENAGPQGSGTDVSGAMFTLTKTDVHAVAFGTDLYNGAITGDIAATLGTPGSSVNASGPTVMQPITFGAQMSVPQTDVDMVQTLQAKNPMAVAFGGDIARSLTARYDSSPCADRGMDVVAVQDVRAVEKAQNGRGWNDDGSAYTVDTHATQGVAVAFAQNTRDEVRLVNGDGQIVGALAAESGMKQTSYVAQPVAWDEELNARADLAGAMLRGGDGGRHDGVMTTTMQVRRLTPVECERLQGFPDGYTNIPWRGKPESPDGPRYKALGNSMAVPVMRWIGERINEVSKL